MSDMEAGESDRSWSDHEVALFSAFSGSWIVPATYRKWAVSLALTAVVVVAMYSAVRLYRRARRRKQAPGHLPQAG